MNIEFGKNDKKGKFEGFKGKILNSEIFESTYERFGIEGIKSLILQELIKIDDPDEIERELVFLAEAATYNIEIKRVLRATKILAAQWAEDPRRGEEVQLKCELIFETIPTFGTTQLSSKLEEVPEYNYSYEDKEIDSNMPYPIPRDNYEVRAENRQQILPGENLFILTDIQGNYEKMEKFLIECGIVEKKGKKIHWSAPPGVKLCIIGDLLNKSPFSKWGEEISFDSFKVVEAVRRLIYESLGNVFVCFGNYDLEVATLAAFFHPISGFLGVKLGVNAQGQALPIMISYLTCTAFSVPDNPYAAWQETISSNGKECFKLKDSFTINGVPNIIVPKDVNGNPDVTLLINFLKHLYQFIDAPAQADRPKSIVEIDKRALQLIPQSRSDLNLEALSKSKVRQALFLGIMKGTGTIDFFRKEIAALHIFETEIKDIYTGYVNLQEETINMLNEIKRKNWEIPNWQELLTRSKTIKMKRIDPEKILSIFLNAGFKTPNSFFALTPELLYNRLVNSKTIDMFIPFLSSRKDKQGFIESYKKFHSSIVNEDPTGLIGYRINSNSQTRKSEPEMKKIGPLDERAVKAYCEKFLMDIFQEKISFEINIMNNEVYAWFPPDNPSFKIGLIIDESAAIYVDENNIVHIPIKHTAKIEYCG